MATNNTQTFKVKIDGVDVIIKNYGDLQKVITQVEDKLKSNTYGADKTKEYQKTLDTLKGKTADFQKQLASNKAGFNVTINGEKQFISTINELEKAKDELDEKLKDTDVGTEAYAKMRAELQKVNTQIEVFEQSVEHVTVEKKLATATAVVGSISGAFATATAGAAVFGKQLGLNEETIKENGEKAQQLVGFLLGIKAATEGVTGENLKNIKAVFGITSARKAEALATAEGEAATKGATLASKLFGTTAKAAIASTGIGLLVVALVLVYEHFDTISSAAQKFGDYIKPLIAFAVTGFNNLKDSIRDAASALTGGFIDDAATQKKQDVASDKLDKLKAEEDYQRKALDLQSNGELERLNKTAAFEKQKLQLMKDSGDASEKEIKAQSQKVQEAEKASTDAIKKFKEDSARKEIDLVAKNEGEKLRLTRNLEQQKLEELKSSVGVENQLYQEQLLVVRAANKAILDDNKAKAKERLAYELDYKKQVIALSDATEQEKAKALLDVDVKELARIQKTNGTKSKEYKDYYLKLIQDFKAYRATLQTESEKPITLNDSLASTAKKVEDNAKAILPTDVKPLTNTDKFNIELQKDIDKAKLAPVVKEVEVTPIVELKENEKSIGQKLTDAIVNSYNDVVNNGEASQINALDSVFGKGFTDSINGASDAILNMSKETKVKELDAQLEFLDQIDERSKQVIDAAQARLDAINEQLNQSEDEVKTLEEAARQARGSEKDDIIKKLELERTKRNQLAADKRKEDDRIKKEQNIQAENEKKRIALEQERQKEIEKTNNIMAITKAINDAVTAGLAIQAAIKAIAGANSVPFPANLAAIAIALSATVAAIASAKAIKFAAGGEVPVDNNGVAVGASHASGGIPFSVAGSPGYEMEGGEHITNKKATSNNIEALSYINKFGANQKFQVVPLKYADGGVAGQVPNFAGIKTSFNTQPDTTSTDKKFYAMQNSINQLVDMIPNLNISVGVDQISKEQENVKVIQNKGLNN